MKNMKGFTLVELLAVIVILGIVALVTTPAILNVINDSREKGAEDKAWGTIDAVKLAYTQAQYDGYENAAGTGVTVSGDNLVVNFGTSPNPVFGSKTISYSGDKPTSGTVTINTKTGIIYGLLLKYESNGTYYCTTNANGTKMCCSTNANDTKVKTNAGCQ